VIHRGGTMLAIAPPNPGTRAIKLEEATGTPWRGNLLWFDPGPPPETPPPGAERIAEGVFTIECLRPHTLARD
ncbi:MAG: hypothetical protein IAG13_21565, partial [Deltaproteobacteria bacterium]|nr:hypothetical protein [Nannocystaceae bacterium]